MFNMTSIGLRELRQNASHWVDRAASGETIEITDRGRPVAQLGPQRHESVYERLVATGEITLPTSDESLADIKPLPRRPGKSLSEIVEEMRGEERY